MYSEGAPFFALCWVLCRMYSDRSSPYTGKLMSSLIFFELKKEERWCEKRFR